MRVFVYEHLCGGGMTAAPASLRAEGRAMLAAVVQDFAHVDGVEVLTLLDEKGDFPGRPETLCRRAPAGEEAVIFRELARWADFTLVIAPELDDTLGTRCDWVLEAAGRLLGPGPEVARLAADKWQLAQLLQERRVPVPRTFRMESSLPPDEYPLVLKPRHGAGSQATFLVGHPAELALASLQARIEVCRDDLLLQSFIPGRPASVALLIGTADRLPLAPAQQHVSADGRFRYQGGILPLPANLAQRAVDLSNRAVAAIPGLFGYVGVDLVLGAAADGSQDRVIEVNPRLTTSYVGLRQLTETNLAGALLRLAIGETVPQPRWHSGPVRFWPDGTVQPARKR
jgi:predicted ATP-grasp superfamily ATP-dependent carboligase